MTYNKYAKYSSRILFWIIGQFTIASGIVFSVKSDLGVSAGSAVPYVLSQVSEITLGTCVTAFFCVLVLLQIILLRKDFEWRNLIQVFGAAIFGVFTDAATYVFGGFTADTYAVKLLFLFLGIILQAIGIAIYIDTHIMLMPAEGIIAAVHQKLLKNTDIGTVKVVVDCFWLLLAVVLSLVFLHRITGIREGTLILALCVGKTMGIIHNITQKPLEHLFYEVNAGP